ncbi:hypothetical protein ONZ43_g723 [Nemania bipapillata]|uniref:Uncharacterized protein n=1 Tax=Nemania bipapillata TaxID=110536 RepID=A0ACC2J748_9PEZI|nr:hypothetical protein ONZ43_g723 [Nemania bipapillata]
MSQKAPSAGTKVKANPDDATLQESTGVVRPDSLAAESQAFRQANAAGIENQQQQQQQHQHQHQQQRRPQEEASSNYPQGATPGETGNGHTVPTYVDRQFRRDPNNPHGKDIKEDDGAETKDSAKNASFSAEIGSKDDPSLLAERKLYQANAVAPGSSGGREKTVGENTAYDVLGDREA